MARTSSRTRTTVRTRTPAAAVNPRTLFLAGLGAVVIGRREAERLAGEAATLPDRLRAGADAAVGAARGEVKKLRRSADLRLAPVRKDIDALGKRIEQAKTQGIGEAAKRLNPLLTRVGLPAIAVPRAVKAKAKPAAKRRPATKKVAKASRRRA